MDSRFHGNDGVRVKRFLVRAIMRCEKEPSRVLLKIAEGHREVVWEVVKPKCPAKRTADAQT
jgi:hypothetical protein